MRNEALGTELSQTSFFGLGTAAFQPFQDSSEAEKNYLGVLNTATDFGCTHIDTAAAYANGFSETVTGKFLKRKQQVRDRLIIASKGGMKGNTANFLKVINASRRRLNCDIIDIYYIHWPVSGVDPRYSLDALTVAREKGWIRYTGLSNFSLPELHSACEHSHVDACQFSYNIIWRQAEKEIIPFCRDRGIACIGYASLAQGLLTAIRKPVSSLHEKDHRRLTVFYSSEYAECIADILHGFKIAEEETGVSLLRIAREWLKIQGQADAALVGASNTEQAAENFLTPNKVPDNALAVFNRVAEKAVNCFGKEENIYLRRP